MRFEHEDAVDKMVREMALHRGSEADILEDSPWEVAQEHNVGASAPKPMTKGGWKVSDAELMQHIMHTAEHVKSESNFRSSFTSFAFAGQALVHPSMLRSASVPSGASSSPADAEPIIVRNKKSAITSSNERLSITINFLDSGDTLVMKVMTSLRVGPATPPKLNPFTELFGAGASTKGFCELKKGFDYQKRQFGTTQRPGWRPEWKESLKEMLAHLTGLDISRLRLYHKNCLMSDELPLSAYGIRNGETFTLMILKEREAHTVGRDITLCSSVKASKTTWEERREQLLAGAIPGHLYSLRQSKHLKECGPGSDVLMMPRWVSQVDPQLFAPVASGITGDGSMKCRVNFNEVPIYMPDMRDPKFIGVRQRISDKKCYTTNYVPLC